MSLINNVLDRISAYIQVKGEKIKLEVMAKMATFLGHFVAFLLLFLVGFFFFVFASIALGAYLNMILQSVYLGYLIISGFYFILAIILILLIRTRKFQKWLEVLFIQLSENSDTDE